MKTSYIGLSSVCHKRVRDTVFKNKIIHIVVLSNVILIEYSIAYSNCTEKHLNVALGSQYDVGKAASV